MAKDAHQVTFFTSHSDASQVYKGIPRYWVDEDRKWLVNYPLLGIKAFESKKESEAYIDALKAGG